MSKIVIGIQIDDRFDCVPEMQGLLTEFGCIIKTRLGLHQQAEAGDNCTEKGLIILELVENCDERCRELEEKLGAIKGLKVRKMEF
jgi:hypothetical protein